MSFITRPILAALRHKRVRATQLLISAFMLAVMLLGPLVSQAQQSDFQWSKPIDITQPSNSSIAIFPVLLCDQYQNSYLMWGEQSKEGAAIYYRNDFDGSWSIPRDIILTPGQVVFGLQGAISNRNDSVHLIWMNTILRGDLYYSRAPLLTSDNPKTWSDPLILANTVDWAAIQVDSDGVIHVVYGSTDEGGLEHSVYHIKSNDGGENWSNPVAAYSVVTPVPAVIRPEMAIDGRQRIHIGISINSQEYAEYSEVGYVQSTDGGSTWSPYKQIQKTGTTFQGVAWIAPYAFGTDEIHLTWHDPRRMHMWSLDGGSTWHGPEEIMPLGAAFGGRNQLVKDNAGTLYVVTAVANGVYSASRSGSQWNAPEQIDDRYIDPHGQVMTSCQGNQLRIAYYDRSGDNRIWYSSRTVDAPHIDRHPIPAPTPQPTNSAANADGSSKIAQLNETAANRLELAGLNQTAANPGALNPLPQVLIPALVVLALITGIVVLRRWRSTR